MFTLASLIGIYSYSLFLLGILGLLYKPCVAVDTIFFTVLLILLTKSISLKKLLETIKIKDKFFKAFLLLLFVQIIVNLIGALGPELSFDALWYHLTLPKIYLLNHGIIHLQGNLYYSDMPKLTEMIYIPAILFGSEISAKLTHFLFGIFCLIVIYRISRKYFTPLISLLSVIIFYENLVVGWESITAYIDLARAFFEILAVYEWLNWYENRQLKWLIASAICIGFAITTKILAFGSLFIFLTLIILASLERKSEFREIIKLVSIYALISLLIPLPWLIFSYVHTGNAFYPFFSSIYPVNTSLLNLNILSFVTDIWSEFTKSSDPLTSVYIAFAPLILINIRNMDSKFRYLLIYGFLALIIWYLTPRTGGGRFILPYLPVFSIICAWILDKYRKTELNSVLNIYVIIICLVSIFYRAVANAKYIPVITGKESKTEFLSKNLNFSFGDFYDTDNYFLKHIKATDKVLLIGFHNLYYIDFPFYDSSWGNYRGKITYIATQKAKLPKQYIGWNKIYNNSVTGVSLYSQNK